MTDLVDKTNRKNFGHMSQIVILLDILKVLKNLTVIQSILNRFVKPTDGLSSALSFCKSRSMINYVPYYSQFLKFV